MQDVNAWDEIMGGFLEALGGKAESFKTQEGDAVAVVNALGIITLGTMSGETGEGASVALTKDEAKRVAITLLTYAS